MSALRGLIAAGVRNPIYPQALTLCILACGYLGARSLVTETYPEYSIDRISIQTAYPGASPEESESAICIKIEQALAGIEGIRKVWSRAEQDGALVIVELHEDVSDHRRLMLDIRDRVDRIDTFPPDVERPVVTELVAREEVVNVAVFGEVSERALKETAVEVRDELLRDPVISQVEMVGLRDYEIAIQVSREALLQYGLNLPEVTAAVARNCLDAPAGTLRTQEEELTIRTTGQRYTAQEFENLVVIARPDGTQIRLGQMAVVRDGFEEDYRSGRFQGRRAAMLQVFRGDNQSIQAIAAAVRRYVEAKRPELPERVELDLWADNSLEVAARTRMLVEDGLVGVVLVVATLAFFLNFRLSLYVALSIPISFAGTFFALWHFDQTINMITLFALITVGGLVVDDAITVGDTFHGRVMAGESPALAAINGPREVALAVLGSSVLTVIAFIPLFFVKGVMGKFIVAMPLVVIAAYFFSAIATYCILPSHLQHCFRPVESPGRIGRWRASVRHRIETWIDGIIRRFYTPVCARAMRGRLVTISGALALIILAIGLYLGGRVPFTLFPEIDGNTLRARVQFPQGITLSRTEEAVRQLEEAADRLSRDPALAHHAGGDLVRRKFSVVGEWSGWLKSRGSQLCEVLIELAPTETRRLDSEVILAAWSKQAGVIDDAIAISFERVERGPTEKPIDVRLLGDDIESLSAAGDEVVSRLARTAGVTGAAHDLLPGRREVRVSLKPLARTLGVTLDDLARQLRAGFYGGEAVRVQRGADEVRVQVRYPDAERQSMADVETVRIGTAGGQSILFSEVAYYRMVRGFSTIYRQEGLRRVKINADVDERVSNAEQVLAHLDQELLRDIPARYPGVQVRLEGQHAEIVESVRSLVSGFLAALLAIYACLAAMLRSYVQPLVIMFNIPLAFVGAVLGHWVLGQDLTMISLFGMVTLAGVVANDSMALVDQINVSIREGEPVHEAVLRCGQRRFRAVMNTFVTTVAGVAPLMLERSTQAQSLMPMVITITFGLSFATLLAMLMVPATYLATNDLRRFARWLRYGGDYPTPEAVEIGHATASVS